MSSRQLARVGVTLAAATMLAGACRAPAATPSPQSPQWTPFHGEFRSVGAGGHARGRVYRSRDGSLRRETMGGDGSAEFVTIENRREARFYSFSRGSWTAQPLELPRARLQPPTGADFPAAQPHPTLVAGRRVVRADTALGTVMLRAPTLDYFPLVEEHPYPALRIEFVSVTDGDVDGHWFTPPVGARVDELPWTYKSSMEP